MYCRNCGVELPSENSDFCVQCGTARGKGDNYCANCGSAVNPGQDMCLNCGTRLVANPGSAKGTGKSKLTAGLLAIFLGAFGVHNFYLGYNTKAVIQLCVSGVSILLACCTAGITALVTLGIGIWGLVEGIMILTGRIDKDAQGNPLE